ncbi:MAG: hypothetical protein ACRDQZ_10355 [Mycobacteriales bacterium]
MTLINLSLLVLLLGFVLWMINFPPSNTRGARLNDAGRLMFWTGLFVWLFCGCAGSRAIAALLR